MATVKISQLTAAAAATGTQELEVNESGTSKKITGAQLATYIEGEVSSSPSFTGQVSLPDGTNTLPSLTNTGDTNTGIYFPAEDEVGIATGGTLRVSVNSGGSLVTTGNIELGHATDTTISRSAAGVIAVEGNNVPSPASQANGDILYRGATNWERLAAGTSGQVLQTNGAGAAPSWATVSSGGTLLRAPQVLTSGTSYTTPAGCTKIYVEAVGGGGGGGGADNSGSGNQYSSGGAGGGSGAYCAKYFTVSASTAYTYAIGAGGNGGTATLGNGTNGGNTTFTVGATTITAGGGSFGKGGNYDSGNGSTGGDGGTATNGDININGTGGVGGHQFTGSSGNIFVMSSGAGGNSFFGGGAPGTFEGQGTAGTSGGGGSGGSTQITTGQAGGAGGAGLIRIWEFA